MSTRRGAPLKIHGAIKGVAVRELSQLTCLSLPERLLQTVRSHVIGMLRAAVVFAGRCHVEFVVETGHFTIKRGQLNTPCLRSKPLLSFLLLHSLLLFLSSSLWRLLLSSPLPHSLFEEVRVSLSLLFSPIAADKPQVPCKSLSVELRCGCASVGGAAGPAR